MGNLSRFINPRYAGDGPSQSSLDNIRRVSGGGEAAPRTGRTDVKRSLAQSPNSTKQDVDRALPLGLARELMRTPEGRMELQGMFNDLSPAGQENFLLSVATQTRDPRSPAKGFALNEEGQAIQDLVLNGGTAPATQEYLKRYRYQVDGDPVGYRPLSEVPSVEDATEKAAPFKPKVKTKDKDKFSDIEDRPSFRSNEKTTLNEDGEYETTHSSVSLGRQTHAAIERAKRGETVYPISSDTALHEDTPPLKSYTQTLNRVAELGDPHTGVPRRSEIDSDGLETMGVPRSVFAPGGSGGPSRSSLATVRPQDHGDLMRLARDAGIANPNEFDSAEDFARALVARAPQEPYNVTPVTASQRAAATEAVGDLIYDPVSGDVSGRTFGGDVPPGAVSEKVVNEEVGRHVPEAVRATKHAERALVQQQVIETLARKAEQVFGHLGWGENYKPGFRKAGTDGPSTETGMRAGMTQDPARVPNLGTPNQRVVSDTADTIPAPFRAGRPMDRPGMEVGEDVGMEELVDLDERKRFATGDPNAPGTPVPAKQAGGVASGRAHGDKEKVKYSPEREERGHEAGAYKDYADFAPHNDGRNASPEDLAARQKFYDEAGGRIESGPNAGKSYRLRDAIPMSTERTSELRQQMQDLIDANPQPGPEVIDQIAKLQRRLKLSQQLDAMSGIHSSRGPDPDSGSLRPEDDPSHPDYTPPVNAMGEPDGFDAIHGDGPPLTADDASLPSSNLAGAQQDLALPRPPQGPAGTVWYRNANGEWVQGRPFDLNGRSVDEPEALPGPAGPPDEPPPPKRLGVDEPTPKPDPMEAEPKKGMSRIKKILIGLGLGAGGLAAYQASQSMSQPEPDAFPPGPPSGPGLDGNGNFAPATSEDRIRALQNAIGRTRLNPYTQTPSSMVQ